MYQSSKYWGQLNSNVYVVGIPNTTAPTSKIRTNFNSSLDATGSAATDVSFTGLRNLKISSAKPNNMVCVLNSASTDHIIWYSTDGGNTWNHPTTGNTTHGLGANISYDGMVMGITRTHASPVYYYSSNEGATWGSIAPSFALPRGLSYNNDGTKGFFVSGSVAKGGLITNVSTITNKTIPWTASDSYMTRDGSKVWIMQYTNASNTVAAYSTNDGTSWTTVTVESGSGIQTGAATMDGSDDGKHIVIWPGATHNHIYVSNDGGVTWNKRTLGATSYGYSLSMSKSGKYIVIASDTVNGKYFYSTDYGQTFSNTTISGVSAIFGALSVQEF